MRLNCSIIDFRIFIDAATLKLDMLATKVYARVDFRIFIDAATLKHKANKLLIMATSNFRIFIDAATLKQLPIEPGMGVKLHISASL